MRSALPGLHTVLWGEIPTPKGANRLVWSDSTMVVEPGPESAEAGKGGSSSVGYESSTPAYGLAPVMEAERFYDRCLLQKFVTR